MLPCGRTIMQYLPLVHYGSKMPNLPIYNPVLIFILGNGTCDLARKTHVRNIILSHHLTNITLQPKISAYPKSFHLHKL